jgi:hypothetical protein
MNLYLVQANVDGEWQTIGINASHMQADEIIRTWQHNLPQFSYRKVAAGYYWPTTKEVLNRDFYLNDLDSPQGL